MSNASDLAPTKAERRGPPSPDRFERLGYGPKHERKPLKELDLRSQLMLEYMLVGCRHKDTCNRIGVEVNEPMSQQQASDAVGFRRRNGRFVFSQPVFQKALAKGIEELRSGNRVKAVLTQVELMNDRGDGSAAAGTLRLKASQALLGDDGKAASVNVNINQNTLNLSAGVVIRLPSEADITPLEMQAKDEEQFDQPALTNSDEHEGLQLDPSALDETIRNWPQTVGRDND